MVDPPTEPDRPGPMGMPSGDMWNDVPLFREIQRVLASSSGPVNWELARQVGIAASMGAEDPAPPLDDVRAFEEAVRVAELQVSSFTGLEPPHDVPVIEVVRRAGWIQENLAGLRSLIEPAAARVGEAFADAQRDAMPEGAPVLAQQMLQQVGPLLLGAQVGSVLGYLAQHVFGQYDIAVPRPESSGRLLFVAANVAAFERDWSLDPREFRTWIALHEVTHRLEFSRPWAAPHFRELLDDFLSTLQVNVEALQRRFETLDPSNPGSLEELLQGEGDLFGTVLDEEQRLKLERVQAFMAAAEGYGDHVMHAIGRRLFTSAGQIEEAMRRYRESESGDPVFERLLGIEMKREQYRAGRAFCDEVAEMTDEATLARMWGSAEALPSRPEIDEPRLWLARTV